MPEKKAGGVPPTVAKVQEQFITALKGDDQIDDDSVSRLEALLSSGNIPKLGELDAALTPPVAKDVK